MTSEDQNREKPGAKNPSDKADQKSPSSIGSSAKKPVMETEKQAPPPVSETEKSAAQPPPPAQKPMPEKPAAEKPKPATKKSQNPASLKEEKKETSLSPAMEPQDKQKKKKLSLKKKSKSLTQKIYREQKKIKEMEKELDYLNKNENTVLIKDAQGRNYCQAENCDQPAMTDIFCRYHYLTGWPHIYKRKMLLKEGYLSKTIKDLVKDFGELAVTCIIQDCKNERTFELATKEMNFMLEGHKNPPNSESDTDIN